MAEHDRGDKDSVVCRVATMNLCQYTIYAWLIGSEASLTSCPYCAIFHNHVTNIVSGT